MLLLHVDKQALVDYGKKVTSRYLIQVDTVESLVERFQIEIVSVLKRGSFAEWHVFFAVPLVLGMGL